MLKILTAALADRRGATAIEYALLAALIAGVIIGAMTLLGSTMAGAFDAVNDAVTEFF